MSWLPRHLFSRSRTNPNPCARKHGGRETSFRPALETLEERWVLSTLSGTVFSDINNNGAMDTAEAGIANVKITLLGTNNQNQKVSLAQNTDATGHYAFTNLQPGTYSVSAQPPGGYFTGTSTPGTNGGTAGNGTITGISLGSTDDLNNNFGELAASAGWSSIKANFNPTAIPAGDTIWFSDAGKLNNISNLTSPATLTVTNQTITFTANGTNYSVSVPDSTITISPATTTASTSYDPTENEWDTIVPLQFAGNTFLGGVALPVTSSLPGGIQNVTWTGQFTSDTKGITLNQVWSAAAYSQFGTDPNSLNVKPVDDKNVSGYPNGDHAGTPEAFKPFVVAGATGGGGPNYTGNYSPGANVTPFVDPPANASTAPVYPYASSDALTNVAFNESSVLVASNLDLTNGFFDVWYSDEHALALGVNQVTVISSSGTTTTNYNVSPLGTNPGAVTNPSVGGTYTPPSQSQLNSITPLALATSQAQGNTDVSGRPLSPALFITDITNNPNSESGDWQYGGTPIAPTNVFGTWKPFAETINLTTSTPTVTLTASTDPAKNGWNLGAGSDAPPAGLTNQGYGAEIRWDLNSLGLQAGHQYRFYVMVHDGDQNKSGGDAGQAAYNESIPTTWGGGGQTSQPVSISGYVYNGTPGVGYSGVTVTLTGTDINGNSVTLITTTASDGSYSFGAAGSGVTLLPGTYTITQTLPSFIVHALSATTGTVSNPATPNAPPTTADGTADPTWTFISNIVLNSGDTGINYDFVDGMSTIG
jgi:hypothetical protein